jgi:hypothetical protein
MSKYLDQARELAKAASEDRYGHVHDEPEEWGDLTKAERRAARKILRDAGLRVVYVMYHGKRWPHWGHTKGVLGRGIEG